MSEWRKVRHWSRADVAATADGYAVMLDEQPARTPAGNQLLFPCRQLAEIVSGEWALLEDEVNPAAMPYTLLANTALDRIGPARHEVVTAISNYASSDLLCFRATEPAGLVVRQSNAWDPVIEWAASRFGARLKVGTGVMPLGQEAEVCGLLEAEIERQDRFILAGLSEMVGLTGSILLGLAVLHGRIAPQTGWNHSMIDEDWQAGKWGVDEEAASVRQRRKQSFLSACDFAFAAQAPDLSSVER